MNQHKNTIAIISCALSSDDSLKRALEIMVRQSFTSECQRFQRIKNRSELTTIELDNIALNASKNFTNMLIAQELKVNF